MNLLMSQKTKKTVLKIFSKFDEMYENILLVRINKFVDEW